MNKPVIFWLNSYTETYGNIEDAVQVLKQNVDDVRIFTDVDQCIDNITDLKDMYVAVIVTYTIGQENIAIIHDLANSIYILCLTEPNHQEYCYQSLSKIKGLFTDMIQMTNKINYDVCRVEYETIKFKIINTLYPGSLPATEPDMKKGSFMYCLLLRDVVLKFDSNDITDMIDYLRNLYHDQSSELKNIDKFEHTYRMDKAIEWYTRDSFLYKLMNKVLRDYDIETLYFMRIFIRHLHQQIVQLQSTDNTQGVTVKTLYRGLRLPFTELKELKKNEGGLLFMQQFLSTTELKDLAEIYAHGCDQEQAGVVFEIKLNRNSRSNSVYASLSEFSHFRNGEAEWLFSMGTVFRIGRAILRNNIWYVRLTLSSNEHKAMEQSAARIGKTIQIEHHNPVIPLYRLLARMGKYEKAIELCEKNTDYNKDWEIMATVFDIHGLMYADQKKDEAALFYYQKALDIVEEHADKNYPFKASYYSNVAISYDSIGQPELAIENYKRAVELELQLASPDYLSAAYSYDAMGAILFYDLENDNDALMCYERARRYMVKTLPSNHSDIYSVYNDMANIYVHQERYDKARQILNKSLRIQKASPNCKQEDINDINTRMALINEVDNETCEDSNMSKVFDQKDDVHPYIQLSDSNNNALKNFIRKIIISPDQN